MVIQTKCAKITDCELMSDGRIGYSARSSSDELFLHYNHKDIFPAQHGQSWTCPQGTYVDVGYYSYDCAAGACHAVHMKPITDFEYLKENYW